jgi:hypothetical protein
MKTETLSNACKEAGLEANKENTKYSLLFCHQNAGRHHDVKIANRPSEDDTIRIFKGNSSKLKLNSGGN